MKPWWQRWLGRPGMVFAVIALGVLLQTPSVTTGFVADDHVQQLILRGVPVEGLPPVGRLDLFAFAKGKERTRAMIDLGFFPWAADPEVRLAFFRPLTSLTHLLDEWAAPGSAVLAHAHNLVWMLLGLGTLWAFYRRFFSGGAIATLALYLYAVDDARGPTVGWIANRNALIALAIALWAVPLHDRWRRDRWKPGAYLAPLALAVGLCGGEAAIAVCGYLAAYALCLERGPWQERVRSLVPYGAVVLVFGVVYRALGYGAHGSGVYADPLGEPLAFLRLLPTRLLVLVNGQLSVPWADLGELGRYAAPGVEAFILGWCALSLAFIAWLAWPLLRRSPEARFFASGMVLSALPVCATFPADRLLTFVGVGGMGLLALLFAEGGRNWLAKLALAGLVLLHVVVEPPTALLRSRSMEAVEHGMKGGRGLALANDSLPKDARLLGRTLVLVNPPGDALAGYLLATRLDRGEAAPARLRWLVGGGSPIELERIDARTLRVRPDQGFLVGDGERMLVSPGHFPALGEKRELAGLSVEITEVTADGRPQEARFRFAVPLEDPSLLWYRWGAAGYEPWPLPKVGARLRLPATDFLQAVM